MKPLDDKVAVKPDEVQTESPGGIVLPDNAQARPTMGEVIAVGPGRPLNDGSRADMSVVVGDRVLFSKYGGSDVEVKGEKIVVIAENQILMVL